jgi:hypothetical protein
MGVFVFEFVRIKAAENRRKLRYLLNALFAISLALGLALGWPYLPKPKEEPNMDRIFAAFADLLSDKIATRLAGLLAKPAPLTRPSPTPTNVSRPWLSLKWNIDQNAISGSNPMIRIDED